MVRDREFELLTPYRALPPLDPACPIGILYFLELASPNAGSFPKRNWKGIGLRAAHAFSSCFASGNAR